MRVSEHGRALLAGWEGGYRTRDYFDSGGEPTIGVGHLLTRFERRSGQLVIGGTPVDYTRGISLAQAAALYAQDLSLAELAVSADVHVPLDANQFDALCCFVFNIGVAEFEDVDKVTPGQQPCTLLRRLNARDYDAVPGQLRKWVHDNGKVVRGLVNRRANEIALWEGRL